MKRQLPVMLLCLFASIYLFSSCKKETQQVPFIGTYVTAIENLTDPPTSPILKLKITGLGHSTHLGKGKFVALSTLNTKTPPPFAFSGPATFYAADGDVFYTTFKGTMTPNKDGTSISVMTHIIKGGTGKFVKATGTFKGYNDC